MVLCWSWCTCSRSLLCSHASATYCHLLTSELSALCYVMCHVTHTMSLFTSELSVLYSILPLCHVSHDMFMSTVLTASAFHLLPSVACGHDSIVLSVCPVMPNLSLLSSKSVTPPLSGQESCGGRKEAAHAGAGYCREEGRDAAGTVEKSCKEISEPLKQITSCRELFSNTRLAYSVAVLYVRMYNTHIVIRTT